MYVQTTYVTVISARCAWGQCWSTILAEYQRKLQTLSPILLLCRFSVESRGEPDGQGVNTQFVLNRF